MLEPADDAAGPAPGTANSVALERGPLVFSLRLGEDWKKLTAGMKKPAPAPAADWEVRADHAVELRTRRRSRNSVEQRDDPRVADRRVPVQPEGAPVELTVTGRRVPEWTIVDGSAGPLPQVPRRAVCPMSV